ncbi:fad synthase [Anaeramoeba flamelloides]|uniref:FAD synthase n=1 Tax=Anaeramoeba flamelloides TaxID=1746091 RepID=A0AAV7ZAT0_9EUKA|nr:fad synthase [Anaeramoeba flamelloides]
MSLDQQPKESKRNDLQTKTSNSVSIIEEAVTRYGYEGLSLSYNGGKDCLTILDLLHSIATGKIPTKLPDKEKLKEIFVFYLHNEDDFEEMEQFVETSLNRYGFFNYKKVTTNSLKRGFVQILKNNPSRKAILLGTRVADLKGRKQAIFAPTDGDWPEAIRISPIMQWHYSNVWEYIRKNQVKYCLLYDKGYTSLGLKSQTKPNPLLKKKNNGGFLPAWKLSEKSFEREGRYVSNSNKHNVENN